MAPPLTLCTFRVSGFRESGLPVSRLLASRTLGSRNAEKGLMSKRYRISRFGESQCKRSPMFFVFQILGCRNDEMPWRLFFRGFVILDYAIPATDNSRSFELLDP
jgi:hypothetical protein